jgi:cytidylate kinase
MKENIRIAVSGRSGCGNTTVSRIIADKLGLQFINYTFRTLAKDRGMNLKTILELAADDDAWDREVDTAQVKLARESGGCVLGSRLAIWMLDDADLKVYLEASPLVRAQRIVKREGGSLNDVTSFTAERDRQDHGRYLKIYNIDTGNYNFADLIINTDKLSPDEIAEKVTEKAFEIN